MSAYHVPVMAQQAAELLVTDEGGVYVDGTLGGAGHTAYLLDRYPGIRVIGIDCDAAAISVAAERLAPFGQRALIVRDNFRNLESVLRTTGSEKVAGVLVDLGVSSRQLDDRTRGFSFESPSLDMRMDDRVSANALALVNTMDEGALADILFRYGDEHRSRPIARRIVERRSRYRITSGPELADIVASVKHRAGKTHPATTVFQALRIAVNDEMGNLEGLLASLPRALRPGGRSVIISYHSLEDRMVKRSFRELSQRLPDAAILTPKPIVASAEETRLNPRARSAKMRAMHV